LLRHGLSDEAVADALLPPGVRGTNALLRHRVIVENNNWTLIEVNSPEEAAEYSKRALQSNVTILHAHWTSGKSACSLSSCYSKLPSDLMLTNHDQ
jgi:hypothetical protein